MREGYADADGVRVHWIDHGGPGPSLVLVHATGFHAHVWDPFLPALTPRFRVVTLDNRGHGLSDKPESGYAWERFAQDVLAVCEALGLETPFASGHSAGGAALVLAEAARPGTFGRLVLLDPVLPDPQLRPLMSGDANPMAGSARKRRAIWETRDQMVDRLRERSPLQNWREDFLRAYVEHGTRPLPDGGYELVCPPAIEAQIYENNGRHDGWEHVSTLACPTVVAAGGHSTFWHPRLRERLAERMPPGTVKLVEGGGHFFPFEQPERTLELLLA